MPLYTEISVEDEPLDYVGKITQVVIGEKLLLKCSDFGKCVSWQVASRN